MLVFRGVQTLRGCCVTRDFLHHLEKIIGGPIRNNPKIHKIISLQ